MILPVTHLEVSNRTPIFLCVWHIIIEHIIIFFIVHAVAIRQNTINSIVNKCKDLNMKLKKHSIRHFITLWNMYMYHNLTLISIRRL